MPRTRQKDGVAGDGVRPSATREAGVKVSAFVIVVSGKLAALRASQFGAAKAAGGEAQGCRECRQRKTEHTCPMYSDGVCLICISCLNQRGF